MEAEFNRIDLIKSPLTNNQYDYIGGIEADYLSPLYIHLSSLETWLNFHLSAYVNKLRN